jgi:hypothetical protein
MEGQITPDEARAALAVAERARRQLVDEVAIPGWYWWSVALGWVLLGVIADLKHGWLTTLATLVFGAAHSTVAPRVIDGRHRLREISVRAELVDRRLPAFVLGGLIILAALTVAGALAASADGARHPVTTASVPVAVAVVCGGPLLVDAVRRRAAMAQ